MLILLNGIALFAIPVLIFVYLHEDFSTCKWWQLPIFWAMDIWDFVAGIFVPMIALCVLILVLFGLPMLLLAAV